MAWVSKDVRLVLRADFVLEMFRRADQWGADSGGRYDRRGAAILIWRAGPPANREAAAPQGRADFLWRTPQQVTATLYEIGWDPAQGGSEELVWEALTVLAGRPMRPA